MRGTLFIIPTFPTAQDLIKKANAYALYSLSSAYEIIGCYKDTSKRAIKTLEGTDPILNGSYSTRKNPIAKCAVAAMRKGYNCFAVQDGGRCAASATAPQAFDKYGKSTACKGDGEGGPWANQVYVIKGSDKFLEFSQLTLRWTTLYSLLLTPYKLIQNSFWRHMFV